MKKNTRYNYSLQKVMFTPYLKVNFTSGMSYTKSLAEGVVGDAFCKGFFCLRTEY